MPWLHRRWMAFAYRIGCTASSLNGNPIVLFAADSSLGCAICDPVIAQWCFARAVRVRLDSPKDETCDMIWPLYDDDRFLKEQNARELSSSSACSRT